jgi:hypothetical protein
MVLWKKSQMGWCQIHMGGPEMRFPWRCGGRYDRDFLRGRLVWNEKEQARMAWVLLHCTHAGELLHGPI